jgi:hypothetical protein
MRVYERFERPTHLGSSDPNHGRPIKVNGGKWVGLEGVFIESTRKQARVKIFCSGRPMYRCLPHEIVEFTTANASARNPVTPPPAHPEGRSTGTTGTMPVSVELALILLARELAIHHINVDDVMPLLHETVSAHHSTTNSQA